MVTLTILAANFILSIMAFNNEVLFSKYMFNPYAIRTRKEHYRFLSHAFIHNDYAHLLINMYVLYSFGSIIEVLFNTDELFGARGTLMYIILYTGSIYASSLVDFARHRFNPGYNAVGASGAVSALVFSTILISPNSGMGIIFLPGISIPSWIFGALYLGYSFYMDKKSEGQIAHGAHAWGAIFGFAFTGILKPSLFVNFFLEIFGG